LERNKIAAEMKDLDQPSRAILRKYGVRFGAYHIYFPALLKPGARSLASLLWVQKQDNVDLSALSGAQHLASTGRTSFPIDKALPRDAYRVLGYRQCGERAVRVDILERLADLIRPALAWRPGSPAQKPPGAIAGGGFTVTVNMTSLTGTSGEDFASVLRSLGYRMEKKPKPVEAPPAPAAAPDAPAEAAPAEAVPADVAPSETTASPETPVEAGVAPIAEAAPEATAAPAEPSAAIEAVAETPAETGVAPEATAEPAAETKPEEKPAEPEMIEVWRPGRPPEERRQRPPRPQGERREGEQRRPPRHRPARPAVAAEGVQAAPPAGEASAAAPAEGAEAKQPERRDDRPRHGRGSRGEPGDKPEQRTGRPPQRERRGGERPDRDRQDRGPRREGGRRDFKDRGNEPREWIDPKERRGGQADPNSPFAKLAALKAQLEANKEGH